MNDKLIIKNKPPNKGIGYLCFFLLLSGKSNKLYNLDMGL